MDNQLKVEHDEIIVTKICRNNYSATCNTTKPFKSEITMNAATEENARKKLELFFNNEPYSHIK